MWLKECIIKNFFIRNKDIVKNSLAQECLVFMFCKKYRARPKNVENKSTRNRAHDYHSVQGISR